jgi:hypothetical protein
MQEKIVEKWGLIVSLATCGWSWMFFWSYSQQPIFSFAAALLAAALTWLGYICLRLLYLTFRRK